MTTSSLATEQQLIWLNQRREQEGLSALDTLISTQELDSLYQQEQSLERQLKSLKSNLPADLDQRLQRQPIAQPTTSYWGFISGFAACLALVGLFQLSSIFTEQTNSGIELTAVNQVMGFDDEIFIEVTVNSDQYIPMATINLSMNSNVQHQRYIGSSDVQWIEPLLPGSNTLTLPLQLFNSNQLGSIDISIESDEIEYNFNISTPDPDLLLSI